MDEDDRMLGYDNTDEMNGLPNATPNTGKMKKSATSENKVSVKAKKATSKGSTGNTGTGSKQAESSAFSFHRMRTLMKTQASVQNITQDATLLVSKATVSIHVTSNQSNLIRGHRFYRNFSFEIWPIAWQKKLWLTTPLMDHTQGTDQRASTIFPSHTIIWQTLSLPTSVWSFCGILFHRRC